MLEEDNEIDWPSIITGIQILPETNFLLVKVLHDYDNYTWTFIVKDFEALCFEIYDRGLFAVKNIEFLKTCGVKEIEDNWEYLKLRYLV